MRLAGRARAFEACGVFFGDWVPYLVSARVEHTFTRDGGDSEDGIAVKGRVGTRRAYLDRDGDEDDEGERTGGLINASINLRYLLRDTSSAFTQYVEL